MSHPSRRSLLDDSLNNADLSVVNNAIMALGLPPAAAAALMNAAPTIDQVAELQVQMAANAPAVPDNFTRNPDGSITVDWDSIADTTLTAPASLTVDTAEDAGSGNPLANSVITSKNLAQDAEINDNTNHRANADIHTTAAEKATLAAHYADTDIHHTHANKAVIDGMQRQSGSTWNPATKTLTINHTDNATGAHVIPVQNQTFQVADLATLAATPTAGRNHRDTIEIPTGVDAGIYWPDTANDQWVKNPV